MDQEDKEKKPNPSGIQLNDFLDISQEEQLERVEQFLRSISDSKK